MVYNGYIGGEIVPRKKIKTKKTQLEAIQRYNARHDRVTLTLPAGTKDKIAEITDKSINRYIADLICCALNKSTSGELNCIDADRPIYTDTDTGTDNTNNIDTNTNADIEQYTTDTGTNNVMDLFD